MKPSRKWRSPTPQVCKEEQYSSKLNTADHIQARRIKGIFMFGSAAQAVTKAKSLLPALKESPNNQKAPEAQVKATKKSSRWSRFEKFRVKIKRHKGLTTWDMLPRSPGKILQRQGR